MDTEAQWLADRTLLRTLLRTQPAWTQQDLADATKRSLGWVKKWVRRLRDAAPEDDQVLHRRSRAQASSTTASLTASLRSAVSKTPLYEMLSFSFSQPLP